MIGDNESERRTRMMFVSVFISISITASWALEGEERDLPVNHFRRRGSSLRSIKELSLAPAELADNERVRSIRQSGHFYSSPALRLLLARRQQWSEPQADSSETVVVKSLPFPSSFYQQSGLGRDPLTRAERDPQLNNFAVQTHQSRGTVRGSFQETPRAAALLAPVQNIVPAPIPAVPSRFPILSAIPAVPSINAVPRRVLRPVPAVPDLPTLSTFTTPSTTGASTRSFPRSSAPRALLRGTIRGRQILRSRPIKKGDDISQQTEKKLEERKHKDALEREERSRSHQKNIQTHITSENKLREFEEVPRNLLARPKITLLSDHPVTTRRPVEDVSRFLNRAGVSLPSKEPVAHPDLGLIAWDDPCLEENHEIIAGQPERSFNHHLSVGTGQGKPPVCDSNLAPGWYRFVSPAGNLLPTECPGGNYCGTKMPVWMKGTVPPVSAGIVETTACINQDRECCVGELSLAVRNCSSMVLYRLQPTPSCSMGYCVGEGVPCPSGLASTNGYTPCDFTVKLSEVVLTQATNALHSEILFLCNPILTDVIEPSSIEIDVKWYVDGENVLSEKFNAADRVSGSLSEEHWEMGHKIHCSAQAKHNVVGARTEAHTSNKMFAGLVILGPPGTLSVEEGGAPALVSLTSTVPVLCTPQERAFGDCCVKLELSLAVISGNQFCPSGEQVDRAGLPSCSHKICSHNWNSTHQIPIRAVDDLLYNSRQILGLDIRTSVATSASKWKHYHLPVKEVTVLPAPVTAKCISDQMIQTFDGALHTQIEEGSFILYQHQGLQYEVQVFYRNCNLRQICHCAVAVRVGEITIAFDICSRGYLQVWTLGKNGLPTSRENIPKGLKLSSIEDGRAYEVYFPSGTYLILGPFLSSVKIFASSSDIGSTRGLCGVLDNNPENEVISSDGQYLCQQKDGECSEFRNSWRLQPSETLFLNKFQDNSNNNSISAPLGPRSTKICACKTSLDHNVEQVSSLNEITTSRFFDSGSLDLDVSCSSHACDDLRAKDTLAEILEQKLEVIVDLETETDSQVATVNVVGGPVVPRPSEGWTNTSAEHFCADFLGTSKAVQACKGLPGVTVQTALTNCRDDVLYAGNTRSALLHLTKIKADCRHSLMHNTSLWIMDDVKNKVLPPSRIMDLLCLNECSGHGQCSRGVCLCADGWLGHDCSVDISAAPRVNNLGNNGLCDVRNSPCRDLVVSGDNFPNVGGLVCHFEVFKIRGVASKQLVQDLVTTEPGKFLSFQQILCNIPTLAIHDYNGRHRFDLKDNTDQTRMFVKVSIGFGQSGPRSAPLDLLLYDSQCWQCNLSGECSAKQNNKCVFSAATSSVQGFRIGKSIAEGEEDFHICSQPHEFGSCDRKEFRYYYNSLERRCKLFVYGGCKGNQNNFLSEIDCVKRCGDDAAIAALAIPDILDQEIQDIDQCAQVKDEGVCPGNVPRFYFDQSAERCLLFSYGGCGGNINNFQSEESCISSCGGPSGALIHAIQLHGGLKPRKPICNLSINRGGCQAKLRRFYFDSSDETCKLFVFGGCQGNENNFETMEECVINCGGPSDRSTTKGVSFSHSTRAPSTTRQTTNFAITGPRQTATILGTGSRQTSITVKSPKKTESSSGGIKSSRKIRPFALRNHTDNTIEFTSISLPTISPCSLPLQIGNCNSFRDRYYFDFEKEQCRKFRFSGCAGNGNNFLTGQNCIKNCGGILEDDTKEGKHISERIVMPTIKPITTSEPEESVGVRKRKMKRVRIRDKVTGQESRLADLHSLARSRASLIARGRLKSRMSSSSSVVTSSTEQSISQESITLELPRVTRPVRTVNNLANFPNSFAQINPERHRVDEVVKTPPNMKSGLVVIRSYCRYPPEKQSSKCDNNVHLQSTYFYNVTSATCEPISIHGCSEIRNSFPSQASCLSSCVVTLPENLGEE